MAIDTYLLPVGVRTLTDSLSPYLLVVVNRGSDVRPQTAVLHARGNGESGNIVLDFGHRTRTRALSLAGIVWRGRSGEGVGEGREQMDGRAFKQTSV